MTTFTDTPDGQTKYCQQCEALGQEVERLKEKFNTERDNYIEIRKALYRDQAELVRMRETLRLLWGQFDTLVSGIDSALEEEPEDLGECMRRLILDDKDSAVVREKVLSLLRPEHQGVEQAQVEDAKARG